MTPGNELLFVALGGSGEIGMNVNLYGSQGKWLMVDLGITFADPAYPGVELVLPDLQFIEERRDDLLGIVLTHGHEDHIGALPYLAEDLGVPLYATAFTAGLIRAKLDEEGIADRVKLRIIEPRTRWDLGPFGLTLVPLAHSIPEAHALLLDTPHGRVFHTGDWKLDADPATATPSAAAELTEIGDAGVFAMFCDSTNIFNNEASGAEQDVVPGLMEVIGNARGRVLVTTFASNVARVQTLGHVARATGRQLCLAGRSLDRITKVARATGYLKDFPEVISMDAAMSLPRNQVLVVGTGGQGEPRAALSRIAERNHPIRLEEGDRVVFSSKQIPGNEIAIGRIMNKLAADGVEMITDRQAKVHVSGHPGRPELAAMYGWIRPQLLVPVHGEMRHLQEQARFARAQGVPATLVQTDGDIVRLAPGTPCKVGNAAVGKLILDGDVILPADGATMNERRRIAAYGQIAVAAAVGRDRRLKGAPQVKIQGIPVEEDRGPFLAEAAEAAELAIRNGAKDWDGLREAVRLAVRRVALRWTGKKPVVDVMLVDV